jgi:RHS repeat-associated protein
VKEGTTTIADYAYDANNNLISTSFGDGTIETRRYDARDRLIHTDTQKGSSTLFSADYSLDPNGNRTEVKEQLGATPRTILYSYDALDRLSQEFELNIGFGKIEYSYDNVGNRTKRNRVGSSDVTTYVYDNNDRLLSATTGTYQEITYAYDNNGNTTQEALKQYGTTIQTTTNTWNDKNQLTGATITRSSSTTTTTYRYDADGIRVASTVNGTETRFLVDPNQPYAQVLEEYSPSGTVQVAYVYGHDLISQTQGAIRSYYHTDGLGSTRVLTDSTGNVLNSYNYKAFGELLNSSGTTNNKYLFAGEQFDSTLNDYYLRARFYDPDSGRFTRRDSYEGSISNPLSLHRYAYTHNNPVNNIDPNGLFTLGDVSAANSIRDILSGIQVDTGQNLVLAVLGDDPTPESAVWQTALGLGLLVSTGIVFGLASRYAKYSRELSDQVENVGRGYDFGQCDRFADAVTRDLKRRGISSQRVRIETRSRAGFSGTITYDGELIANNGYHEGVVVEAYGEKRVFDNINKRGVPLNEWLNKLEAYDGIFSVRFDPISLD